jgi:lysine 2,3-aminomutase
MPQKILTDHEWVDELTAVVERGRTLHKEVVIHTHFGHANEITEITQKATNRLMERGITVRNQSVFQRGVNDTIEAMQLLVKRLSYVNVHPYYVYVHDMVKGVEDLRTTVQTAIDVEKAVRGFTAGYNTPTFVVDAPGGGGKRGVHSFEHYDRRSSRVATSCTSIPSTCSPKRVRSAGRIPWNRTAWSKPPSRRPTSMPAQLPPRAR